MAGFENRSMMDGMVAIREVLRAFATDARGMSRIDAGVVLAMVAVNVLLIWYYLSDDDPDTAGSAPAVTAAEAAGFGWSLGIGIVVAVLAFGMLILWLALRDSPTISPPRKGFARFAAREREIAARADSPAAPVDIDNALLNRHILRALEPRLGQSLRALICHALPGEIEDPAEFQDDPFYIGGEVELGFGSAGSVFVTWEQNAGFKDVVSLQARTDTAFKPGALAAFDIGGLPSWGRFIDRSLSAIEVLGDNQGPCLLSLHFGDAALHIAQGIGGDGYRFGLGDDVIVTTLLRPDKTAGLTVLARLPAAPPT